MGAFYIVCTWAIVNLRFSVDFIVVVNVIPPPLGGEFLFFGI